MTSQNQLVLQSSTPAPATPYSLNQLSPSTVFAPEFEIAQIQRPRARSRYNHTEEQAAEEADLYATLEKENDSSVQERMFELRDAVAKSTVAAIQSNLPLVKTDDQVNSEIYRLKQVIVELNARILELEEHDSEDYSSDVDLVKAFIKDHLVKDASAQILLKPMKAAISMYAKKTGRTIKPGRIVECLREVGITSTNSGGRFYPGWTFKHDSLLVKPLVSQFGKI